MEIVIGEPVTNNNPKNCFRLTINHMHGDADAKTTTTHTFKGVSYGNVSLKTLVAAIELAKTLGHDFFYSREYRNKALQYAGFSDEIIEQITDFMESDSTNDGNTYAIWEDYTIVFFDENGIKHHVEVRK